MEEQLSEVQVGLQIKDAVTLYLGLPAAGCLYYPGPKRAKAGSVFIRTWWDKRSEGYRCELQPWSDIHLARNKTRKASCLEINSLPSSSPPIARSFSRFSTDQTKLIATVIGAQVMQYIEVNLLGHQTGQRRLPNRPGGLRMENNQHISSRENSHHRGIYKVFKSVKRTDGYLVKSLIHLDLWFQILS